MGKDITVDDGEVGDVGLDCRGVEVVVVEAYTVHKISLLLYGR